MDQSSREKLRRIFLAVFELPEDSDVSMLEQGKSEVWDSLAHVSLIAAMESEFGISLDAGDMMRVSSYDVAVLVLEEQGL